MSYKFVAALALLAVANAGVLPANQVYHAVPAAHAYHAVQAAHTYEVAPAAHVYHAASAAVHKTVTPILTDDEFNPHPQYKYGYNVHDAVSGDSKSQIEERDGDAVRGEYSLIDADGFKRTVQYTADDHNGFNAVVRREPFVKVVNSVAHYNAPAAVVKTGAPVVHYAAPAIIKHVIPVARYAAPATVVKNLSPLDHYSAPAVLKTVAPSYTTYSIPAHHN